MKSSLTSSWRELDGDVFVRGVQEAGVQIDLEVNIDIEFLVDWNWLSFDQQIQLRIKIISLFTYLITQILHLEFLDNLKY